MSTTQPRSAPPGTMTYEEFLDWVDEDTLAEWVDGQVILTYPHSLSRQKLNGFLINVLSRYVEFQRLGMVIPGPFQMKLAHSGRAPDILFLAQTHRVRPQDVYLSGPADFVVEVVDTQMDPAGVTRDRDDKFKEYQQGGVAEYWLLDPANQQAKFYQLDAQGSYQPVLPDAQGIYRSAAVPGFWLNIAWLWQDPLPGEQDVLLQIIGQPYADYLRQRMRQHGL